MLRLTFLRFLTGKRKDGNSHTKGDDSPQMQLLCWWLGTNRADLGPTVKRRCRLGPGSLTWSRSFEFLGACSSGQVTCKPGPESFTNALMWALRALEAKHKRFTVSELACKIREAPGFPSDQVPAFFIRAPCAIERIMLSPLDDIRDDPAAASEEFMSQELLQLNFGLAERASIKMIEKLAKTIDLALSKAQLPVNWVAWGGLNSLGGPRPYLHSDLRVIQAVRLFQDGINRKKSRKESQWKECQIIAREQRDWPNG